MTREEFREKWGSLPSQLRRFIIEAVSLEDEQDIGFNAKRMMAALLARYEVIGIIDNFLAFLGWKEES